MLTCFVVSPLLGLSSPSDLVSLTTLRAASSLVSLPERREQCGQKQIAAEKSAPHPNHCRREAVPWPTLILPVPYGGDPENPTASTHDITAASHRQAAPLVWVQCCPLHKMKKDLGYSTAICCFRSKYAGT